MDLSLTLAALPLWASFTLLVLLTTALAMCGPYVARRLFGLDWLVGNNEVAGFKFAVLGVVYAVLLGFAVIVVWEKFTGADAAVTEEASGLVGLYRLADGLPPPDHAALVAAENHYIEVVLRKDWPAMSRGRLDDAAGHALTSLYGAVLRFQPNDPRGAAVLASLLDELRVVVQGRRARLLLVTDDMPEMLWYVLFAGAIVTLVFTFFFGSRSLRAQTLMAGLLSSIIFMALFVVVEIDHPFTGPVSVGPGEMITALKVAGHPEP